MIDRAPDPVDRRAQRVKLSSAGQQALTAALQTRRALLERSLDGWTPADLEQLDHLLTRFVGDIDTFTENWSKHDRAGTWTLRQHVGVPGVSREIGRGGGAAGERIARPQCSSHASGDYLSHRRSWSSWAA